MSYCRFSSSGWRSDVYVYASVGGGYMCHVAGRRREGLEALLPEVFPDDREINVDTGEWFDAIHAFVKAHNDNMETLGKLPLVKLEHGLKDFHCDTAAEMADWLEGVARPAGLFVPQYAIDALREEEEGVHLNDEPTILPADHAAIIFSPDGGTRILIPTGSRDDEEINAGVINVMRAALLFGEGENCDRLRKLADELIKQQVDENDAAEGRPPRSRKGS